MFGNTTGLRLLIYAKADSKLIPYSYIKYAMTHVADLETPAKQCTRMPPPRCMASLINAIAAGKCLNKL